MLDDAGGVSARVAGTVEFVGRGADDEAPMHAEIYAARPDVMAIVHTHQPGIVAFGDAERPMRPISGLGTNLLFREFPVYRSPLPVTTRERALALVRALGPASFVHLRNHGLTLVGESIEAVVLEAIWLEHHARMTTSATAAGTPRGMSAANADVKATERFGDAARWQYYVSLLADKGRRTAAWSRRG